MTPRVAILTRTRNRPHFLERNLHSVRAQTLRDWVQVIINDGGDPEAVEAAVARIAGPDRGAYRILHHAAAQGMQAAANAGLAACDSEFVVLLDDDDTWEPEFLEKTVAFLDREGPGSPYQGVVSQTVRVWESVQAETLVELSREPYQPLRVVNLFRVGYENPFAPVAFVWRRAVLEELKGFREAFDVAGDLDFNLRFLLRHEIGVLPEVLACYHWRQPGTAGEAGNSVVEQKSHHARKLNEVLNHYLRPGSPEGAPELGLALELARILLLLQWESKLTQTKLDGLREHGVDRELARELMAETVWRLSQEAITPLGTELSKRLEKLTATQATREEARKLADEVVWKLHAEGFDPTRERLLAALAESRDAVAAQVLAHTQALAEQTVSPDLARKLMEEGAWKVGTELGPRLEIQKARMEALAAEVQELRGLEAARQKRERQRRILLQLGPLCLSWNPRA